MRVQRSAYSTPIIRSVPICDHFAQRSGANKIVFSGTVDLRQADSAYHCRINAFRQTVAHPSILSAEIVNWDLFDQQAQAFGLSENDCTLHYCLHFSGGETLSTNLVHPQMQKILNDHNNPFYRFVSQHPGLKNISLHLGYGCENTIANPVDKHPEPQHPLLSIKEIEQRIMDSLFSFKAGLRAAGYQGNILIEALDYHKDLLDGQVVSANARITDPDFIQMVMSKTGFGFLLDFAHITITAHTRGYASAQEYLSQFINETNIHLVKEFHLTVPQLIDGVLWDKHRSLTATQNTPEQQMILDLIQYVVELRKKAREAVSPMLINFEYTPEDWANDTSLLMSFLALI